jgi:hypothetical protein
MTTPGPPPGYASDPQLIMLWTSPPDLTGQGMMANGGGSSSMPPLSMPYNVALASVQAALQSMLDAGAAIVPPYNELEQEVQQAVTQDTIFGQQATYNTAGTSHMPTGKFVIPGSSGTNQVLAGDGMNPANYHQPDTPLQQAAQQFATQMNPAMTRIVRLMADSMSTVGTYIALVNKAEQMYTAADKSSAIPPPPAPS